MALSVSAILSSWAKAPKFLLKLSALILPLLFIILSQKEDDDTGSCGSDELFAFMQ